MYFYRTAVVEVSTAFMTSHTKMNRRYVPVPVRHGTSTIYTSTGTGIYAEGAGGFSRQAKFSAGIDDIVDE